MPRCSCRKPYTDPWCKIHGSVVFLGDVIDPPMDVSKLTPEAIDQAVKDGIEFLQKVNRR